MRERVVVKCAYSVGLEYLIRKSGIGCLEYNVCCAGLSGQAVHIFNIHTALVQCLKQGLQTAGYMGYLDDGYAGEQRRDSAGITVIN